MAITRRTWLKAAGVFGGAGLIGAGFVWRKVAAPDAADLTGWPGFSDTDVALLNAVVDTLLPETDSPGAGAAQVGRFIAGAITECVEPEAQAVFVAGLRRLEADCRAQYGRDFAGLSAEERLDYLTAIDRERWWRETWNRGQRGFRILARPLVGIGPPLTQVPHYFSLLKELAVRGYFTSKEGATMALRHQAIPGEYIGDLPYRKGDRAWSM